MKTIVKSIVLMSLLSLALASCKKEDEEGELDIAFKSGSGYVSADATVASGSSLLIGIEAETEKAKDPLIKFNISESVNSGSNATVYSQDLDDKDFEYDYALTMSDTVSGNMHTYTFTVTNRDGLNAQKSLTVTVQ